MGSTKTSSTTTVTATPQEQALEQQEFDMNSFMQPIQKQLYSQLGLGNILPILQGQSPAATGVGGVTEAQNQSMANASLRTVMPQLQANGLMDSGTGAQAMVRSVQDSSNTNAQFNVSAAQNLFNLAVGGQSNLQSQGTALSSVLGSQLAGLRSTSSSGSSTKAWGDYAMDYYKTNASVAAAAAGACWVAAELFGGWDTYKTCAARFYITCLAPIWFKEFYLKHGEQFAEFISDKPLIKMVIRPLFEMFVILAEQNYRMVRV